MPDHDRPSPPVRVVLRLLGFTVAGVVWMLAAHVHPARADGCPSATPSYTGPCGPTFALPGWGDAGGWTDPSKYSTIQLADVNGDGRDELLARNDDGLEIWEFDTTVGQWRPQVDANGVRQALGAFRSPLPSEQDGPNWTQPQYYSTIQTADVDGQPGAEVLARFAAGVAVFKYNAPPGGGIDGGTWSQLSSGGPFSDAAGWTDPSLYSTIRTGHFNANDPSELDLVSRTHGGLAGYAWNGAGWQPLNVPPPDASTEYGDTMCSQPSCYLDFRAAHLCPHAARYAPQVCYGGRDRLLGRAAPTITTPGGIDGFFTKSANPFSGNPLGWNVQEGGYTSGFLQSLVFSDGLRVPDCPFGAGPPAGQQDCFGTSPAYYETLQTADVDGTVDSLGLKDAELLARANDGVRVRKFAPYSPGFWHWVSLPTLTGLAGAASDWASTPGRWGSMRTGDINGDGRDEVLALDGQGLEAWSYSPQSQSWGELQPSTPLALTGDWLTHPEYYATIQVGDVDGDGRADVVARGPYGIRTWFYNRRGTGGWERYLPDGYPAFSTAGQQAAYAELTLLAKSFAGIPTTARSVRDLWAGENAPAPSDLNYLAQKLPFFADCSGLNPSNPPSYRSCTPPAGGSGFTAADWTAVVNEVLSELFDAQQVVAHFDQIDNLRQRIFISQGASLPAINDDLKLAAGAGTTTSYDLQGLFSGVTEIAGAIAGVSSGPAGAALSIVGDLMSMLPSGSPAATDTYQTSYDGLQDTFATIIQQTDNALDAHSQDVRQDLGLLTLVGQLRSSGTWTLDGTGLQSAADEGFALWTYQTLLPSVYVRYRITSCNNQQRAVCIPVGAGPGVVGGGESFTTLGLPPSNTGTTSGIPCRLTSAYPTTYLCQFDTPSSDLANRLWGPVSPKCRYQPGNATNEWTFGCSLGIDVGTSVGANSPDWNFQTYTGDPFVAPGGASARAALARTPRPGSLAIAKRHSGQLRIRQTITLPRGLRLARARIVHDRMLYEGAGRGELVRRRSGRALAPLVLRRTSTGEYEHRAPEHPRVHLSLHRIAGGPLARLDLRISNMNIALPPAACHALPAADALATPEVELQTRVRIGDGRYHRTLLLRHHWRCRRDHKGNIATLAPIRPKRLPARPGLRIALHGPRSVRAGGTATVLVTVSNRRSRRTRRVVSSLWDLRVTGTAGGAPTTVRLRELRARRSRTMRLALPVPNTARGTACVAVSARAGSARSASAQRCARVAATPTRFTG